MNPPPTVGLKTLIIFGLSFAKQLAHGLVKRFAGYVTLLNAFVLITVNAEFGSGKGKTQAPDFYLFRIRHSEFR